MSRTDYSRRAPSDAGATGPAPGTQSLAIPAAYAGRRLDQALAELLPEHSRSRLKQWIESGDVRVDGAAAEPRRKLRGGEHIALTAVPAAPLDDAPEDIPLAILHEDDALLVLDKPAGLVVHPGSGNRAGTLLNALLHHAPALAALPRAGIVHRLDKDTSGLMVVGKTLVAVTALVRAIAAREVRRRYLAIAQGRAPAAPFSVEAPIGRDPQMRLRMAVVASGKPARTDVERLGGDERFSALRCTLHTGRTHQIRVHLASRRLPLVADRLYGGKPAEGIERQALHAAELAFAHPRSGEPLAFASPLPADLEPLWRRLAGSPA